MKYLIIIALLMGCSKEIEHLVIKEPMAFCLKIDTTTKNITDCQD